MGRILFLHFDPCFFIIRPSEVFEVTLAVCWDVISLTGGSSWLRPILCVWRSAEWPSTSLRGHQFVPHMQHTSPEGANHSLRLHRHDDLRLAGISLVRGMCEAGLHSFATRSLPGRRRPGEDQPKGHQKTLLPLHMDLLTNLVVIRQIITLMLTFLLTAAALTSQS